jgi:hypothetical protein
VCVYDEGLDTFFSYLRRGGKEILEDWISRSVVFFSVIRHSFSRLQSFVSAMSPFLSLVLIALLAVSGSVASPLKERCKPATFHFVLGNFELTGTSYGLQSVCHLQLNGAVCCCGVLLKQPQLRWRQN